MYQRFAAFIAICGLVGCASREEVRNEATPKQDIAHATMRSDLLANAFPGATATTSYALAYSYDPAADAKHCTLYIIETATMRIAAMSVSFTHGIVKAVAGHEMLADIPNLPVDAARERPPVQQSGVAYCIVRSTGGGELIAVADGDTGHLLVYTLAQRENPLRSRFELIGSVSLRQLFGAAAPNVPLR